jgi:hypothetical protein
MAIDRPKILTAITVPSGGWGLRFTVSDSGSLDTALDATISAGTYYVSWDGQSDDLLYEVSLQMKAAITAGPGGVRYPFVSLTSDNKVKFWFSGSGFTGAPGQDVEINWSHANTNANLAAALGFKTSADDQSTGADNPTFTADYAHGYGWYASEDGWLESLLVEDSSVTVAPQAVSYAGRVSTQQLAEQWRNELTLAFLTRAKTYSREVGYGSTPVNPYTRNAALECWWEEAKKGVRFRVYRDGRNDTTAAAEQGTATSDNTTTVTDSNKSLATDPQRYLHALYQGTSEDDADVRFRIASHTATVYTAPNAQASGATWDAGASSVYYLIDQWYETYVVDVSSMREFAPEEIPNIDKYRITIPMLRYVA